MWSHPPSFRPPCRHSDSPQPSFRLPPTVIPANFSSFRLAPESMLAASMSSRFPQPSSRFPQPSFRRIFRHSGASRNLCLPAPCHSGSPSRHPGSPSRHSGASRNLCLPPPRHSASPSRHPASPNRHSGEFFRHSGASRNLCLPPPCHSGSPSRHSGPAAVIPAQAGIYACRLHYRSRGCTTPESGASRNDGCRGIAMMKTYAGLW